MLKIIITGDFCPIFSNSGGIGENFYSGIFKGFLDSIADKDLHITNLECPLTRNNIKILKDGPCIKADPEMIEALKYAQVDVACLANNHILDFGALGLMDTIALCNKAGIKTVGAGNDLNEASEPLYLSVKDRNIAIINITQNEFSSALKDKAGANPLNIIQNFYSIKEARKHSSIVLVIVHGGNEDYNLPSERIVEAYRFFADIGASAVISHHSHCLSGYEVYKDVPIFYGLGNFIFECPFTDVPDSWYTGMMLSLNINSEEKISFELKPFYQFKEGPGLKFLEGSEKNAVMKEIDLYSEIIKDKRKLQQKWDEFSEKSRHYYYTELTGLGKIRRKLYRFPFMQKLIFPLKRKIVLYDMIKCEAHNDVISDLLINDISKG
jgi:poly-gamma-glutamate synthesis protein (capsule biosynthesis protein)